MRICRGAGEGGRERQEYESMVECRYDCLVAQESSQCPIVTHQGECFNNDSEGS